MTPQQKKARDEASEKYQAGIFDQNPDGFTVAPYVNSETLADAYLCGADFWYERAKVLEDALNKTVMAWENVDLTGDLSGVSDAIELSREALKKYRGGEE